MVKKSSCGASTRIQISVDIPRRSGIVICWDRNSIFWPVPTFQLPFGDHSHSREFLSSRGHFTQISGSDERSEKVPSLTPQSDVKKKLFQFHVGNSAFPWQPKVLAGGSVPSPGKGWSREPFPQPESNDLHAPLWSQNQTFALPWPSFN